MLLIGELGGISKCHLTANFFIVRGDKRKSQNKSRTNHLKFNYEDQSRKEERRKMYGD